MYVITLYDVENTPHGYYGHVVMDEKIYPQILDDILSYDRTPLRTEWDWEEYTREEYEEEFEIPRPPVNSVVLTSEGSAYMVEGRYTKKLKQYLDSTTPQQRKELELVFEQVNKLVKPFRDWIQSSLDYYVDEEVTDTK